MNMADIGTLAALAWVLITQGSMIWYARVRRPLSLREALIFNAIFSTIFGGIVGWTGHSWFVFIVMTLGALVGSALTMLAWVENTRKRGRNQVGYLAVSKGQGPITYIQQKVQRTPQRRLVRGIAIAVALVLLGIRVYLALRR